jgi:hypothetical protein
MKMQPIESMLSYSNSFEKTECVGKKLKNIAPNYWLTAIKVLQNIVNINKQ